MLAVNRKITHIPQKFSLNSLPYSPHSYSASTRLKAVRCQRYTDMSPCIWSLMQGLGQPYVNVGSAALSPGLTAHFADRRRRELGSGHGGLPAAEVRRRERPSH